MFNENFVGKRKLPNCVFNPIISDLVRFSPNGAFIWHTVVNPVSHSSKKFNLYYSSKHSIQCRIGISILGKYCFNLTQHFKWKMTFGLNFSVCGAVLGNLNLCYKQKKQDFINLNKAGSAFGQYIDWQVDEIQGKKNFFPSCKLATEVSLNLQLQ